MTRAPTTDRRTRSAAAAVPTGPPAAPPAGRGLRVDAGLLAALASAAAFGTAGAFSKGLLGAGWTPGSVVLLRVSGAAVILIVPALLACRGRWGAVRANLRTIVAFGLVAVVGAQVSYVNAIEHLSVGVALLLEYLAVVLVALWVWLRTRRAPSRLTWVGMVTSIAGLLLVLDLAGQSPPVPVGVVWGLLAAVGLATYFITAADDRSDLPPVALAGFGMTVGAVTLAALGATGLLPMSFATAAVQLAGTAVPFWLAVAELAVLAAAVAYLLGMLAARRLGAGVASFVGLTEVLFAVLFAWLLLGELPTPVQLLGGVLIVAGVVAVRAGETPSRTRGGARRRTLGSRFRGDHARAHRTSR